MDSKKIMAFIVILKLKIKKFHSERPSSKKRRLKIQIIKLFLLCKKLLNSIKCRSQWVRYVFTEERRFLPGSSNNLLVELELYDREKYFNYLRITPELFYQLLNIVGPSIEKNKSIIRETIPAKTRLQIFFAIFVLRK